MSSNFNNLEDRFSNKKAIGHGQFGTVYEANDNEMGKIVALKKFSKVLSVQKF